MPSNRTILRNTRFYNPPEVLLGGFYQNGSITGANFLSILEILLVTGGRTVSVRERSSRHIVTRNDLPLVPGEYDILCPGLPVGLSNEAWVYRLISQATSSREPAFRDGVRDRDRKCVISGIALTDLLMEAGEWSSFEAAYIFPLAHESDWIRLGYSRWITDDATGSKINSIQNGFLLCSHIHQKFDQYLISVNPDDGYKVVVFEPDIFQLDGRILDPVCRDPAGPHCVPDQLLKWHFRQSVLANMRGAGEPVFEHDFPPGTDMVGEILAGPYGKERFELEMAVRLRGIS